MEIINQNKYPLPSQLSEYFDRVYAVFLSKFNLKKDLSVELAVIDEDTISFLNKTYRSKDGSTDVLSFPMDPEEFDSFLGAIYFCYPIVNKKYQDLLFGFCFLFSHSLLHLLGYEHSEEMFSLQDEIIKEALR